MKTQEKKRVMRLLLTIQTAESLERGWWGDWIDIDGDNIPYAIERNLGKMYRDRFDGMPCIESIRRFEEEFNESDRTEKNKIYNQTFNAFVQDKAKQVTDVLSRVMNYIKPFTSVISPMGFSLVFIHYPGSSPYSIPTVEFIILLQRVRQII